jgi:hypothetical protein
MYCDPSACSPGFNGANTVRVFFITKVMGDKLDYRDVGVCPNSKVPQCIQPMKGAVQKGNNWKIDTGDNRVLDAVWSVGNLWVSFNSKCPDQDLTCIGLIQIMTPDTKKFVLSQKIQFTERGKNSFYPAITIDGKGNLNVIYGWSSDKDFPSLSITGRALDDKPNTLRNPIVIAPGKQAYQPHPVVCDLFSGTCPYGDYFEAAPSGFCTAWVAGEYVNDKTWNTWIQLMSLCGM